MKYGGAAHRIFNLKDIVPKEISLVSHNGSNYDYYFKINELAEEFEKQFTCLVENTKKYITFLDLTQNKFTSINKNGAQITKIIFCRLRFTGSARFITISL